MGVTILPVATLVWEGRRVEAERAGLLAREQSARAEAEERRRIAEELARTARSFTETLDVGDVGARVVGVILERMIEALEDGGRVELRGFGALSVRSRDARAGRNPRTGEPVDVRAKHVPFFKSGKELRERLNATDE